MLCLMLPRPGEQPAPWSNARGEVGVWACTSMEFALLLDLLVPSGNPHVPYCAIYADIGVLVEGG